MTYKSALFFIVSGCGIARCETAKLRGKSCGDWEELSCARFCTRPGVPARVVSELATIRKQLAFRLILS